MEYFCLLTFCLNWRTILHCLVWTPCPSGGWNEFFVYRKVDLSRTRPKLRLWLRTLTRRWVQKSIIRLFRISSPNCLVSTRRTSGASSTMSTTWNISSPCQRSGCLQQLRKMPIAMLTICLNKSRDNETTNRCAHVTDVWIVELQDELNKLLENSANTNALWDALHTAHQTPAAETQKGRKGKKWKGKAWKKWLPPRFLLFLCS